ncbi:DUF2752 domain-containing protein [Streptomyces sp. PRB2-1]|uniref:DUF2752 domain-containing protein n=1 Tax=Actinacidiphila epipremni TaxID=2053013 RepID=A0ABX1A0G0_9ACTN|nr:DUF2752 domain-containing protein [Actinacidiphila epipremni]
MSGTAGRAARAPAAGAAPAASAVPAAPASASARRVFGHPAAGPLGALAVGAAAAAYLYRTDPHQPGHLLPRCPFNWATGLLCPVCGATRMAYDLLHADPVRAFHDNALLLLCTPFLLAVAGRWAALGLRGRRWRPVLGARASVAVAVLLVAWAVLRNVY